MAYVFASLFVFCASSSNHLAGNPDSPMIRGRLGFIAFSILILILARPLSAQATPILGSVSVSSPQGDRGLVVPSVLLVNIINQFGLSAGYISGVTDFSAFTASATHSGLNGVAFTDTESNGPQQFTFDLGTSQFIDGIAIWNTTSAGRVTTFSLFSDTDSNFGNGTSGLLLGSTAIGPGGLLAYVSAFAPTNTRYRHVNGLSSQLPPDYYGLAEVAFRSAVPEPSTLALAAFGLLGLLIAASRRRFRRYRMWQSNSLCSCW